MNLLSVISKKEPSPSPRKSVQQSVLSDYIDEARRNRLISEVRPLLDTHTRCKTIWHSLQQADFKRIGRLDDRAIAIFFSRQKANLQELLLVKDADDLQQLVDEDEDGFWNEDEQILLFSLIKERLQNLARELCNVFEYTLQKQLMSVIREIESQIVKYQDILRRRTHEKELQTYAEIGEQKLQKFNEVCAAKVSQFQAEKERKMRQLESRHEAEMERLNTELSKDVNFTKIKPKAKMLDMHTEEKLYAVSERFSEAQTIRNELKFLETEEQNRVQNHILAEQAKKRKALAAKHANEIRQMQSKNETAYNNFTIKMETEKNRLNKEINLYYNDITKNQNLAARLAHKDGRIKDELRRTKAKSQLMMRYLKDSRIANSKRSMTRASSLAGIGSTQGSIASSRTPMGVSTLMSTVLSKIPQINPLKGISKSVTRFRIQSDATGSYRPVNVQPDFVSSTSLSSRTGKLLDHKLQKHNTLPSLAELYDDELEVLRH